MIAVFAFVGLSDALSSDTLGTSSEHSSNIGSRGSLYSEVQHRV